jgi:hypothetical protein
MYHSYPFDVIKLLLSGLSTYTIVSIRHNTMGRQAHIHTGRTGSASAELRSRDWMGQTQYQSSMYHTAITPRFIILAFSIGVSPHMTTGSSVE